MIYGIGTDIVEVDRISDRIARSNGFKELVFTPAEIAWCDSQVRSGESYAARFAAKEALLKAMGTGYMHGGIHFNEIEITNTPEGKPLLTLIGNASTCYDKLQIKQILVSLSHIKTTAVATVIIEV